MADYPTAVLEKHWPDVPRWRDIRQLTKESFYERTRGLRTVDVISGGFPCQPFSVAGKQRGKEDERFLWPEMLRVIRELRPHCVVGENVPGIIGIAARQVVEDLERESYNVLVFNFEAAIDAIMKVYVRTAGYKARERVFEAEEAVHRLPVADVAPVRRGHWIEENGCQICSECGEEHEWDEYRAAYCDVCGAEMEVDNG